MQELDKPTYLIILTGSLGDVVRGLPLIDAIKAAKPAARVSWLIEDKWQKILSLHPALDEMIVFERKRGLRGVFALWKILRARHFDVVLDLQRHFKSGVFNRFARATRRIGFARRDSKEGNWLFQHEYIPERGNTIPKTEHYLLFLDQLAIARPPALTFGFERIDAKNLAGIHGKSAQQDRIGLVLGSSWPSKDWLPSGYAQLIKLLREKTQHEVLLLGDGSQRTLADQLVAALGSERISDLVGCTTLTELVAVIHQCQVVVGPDSGPGHISAAVGTPYVTLFGPTEPLRVAPFGMLDLALRADIGCAPCLRRECPGLDRLCMRLISAEDVFGKLEPLLTSR
jgi:ADP-heptose:LPS heptosyltransferase